MPRLGARVGHGRAGPVDPPGGDEPRQLVVRRRAAERRALRRLGGRRQEPHRDRDGADTAAVRAAVSTLPRRQRQAVVLRYYSDLPAREVAALMGCAEATVRTLTRDGLAGLRSRLSDDWEVLDVL